MCVRERERRERKRDYRKKRQKVRRDYRDEIIEKETQGTDLNRKWRERCTCIMFCVSDKQC